VRAAESILRGECFYTILLQATLAGIGIWSVRLRVRNANKLRPDFRQKSLRFPCGALNEPDLAHEVHDSLVVWVRAGEKLAIGRSKLVRVRQNVLLIPNGGRRVAEMPPSIVTIAVLPGTIMLGKLGEKPIPKTVLLELAYEVIARFQGSVLSGAAWLESLRGLNLHH
jgi:hypothetical protein